MEQKNNDFETERMEVLLGKCFELLIFTGKPPGHFRLIAASQNVMSSPLQQANASYGKRIYNPFLISFQPPDLSYVFSYMTLPSV